MRRLLAVLLLAIALPALAQTDRPPDAAPAGTLAGVVTDAETGRPVVGAGVVIPALAIGAVSERDGRYEIAGVPPGTHAVRAGAYLYHLVTLPAEVGAAGTLDVALRPGAGAGCAVAHTHGDDGSHLTSPPDGR